MRHRIDLHQALLDPSSQFLEPADVVDARGLTREQKIDILERWEYDECEIAVAEEEGMRGTSTIRIHETLAALRELRTGFNPDHVAPNKHHGLSSDVGAGQR